MSEKATTDGLQSIINLKDESIQELNTLHVDAVSVIDNSQVVAAAVLSKTEVQTHLNDVYTEYDTKRASVINDKESYIHDREYLYNQNIELQEKRLIDHIDSQYDILKDRVESTPTSKIAKSTTLVDGHGVDDVGLNKYSSGYKFPYKPSFYLNGGLVDKINGIVPRGYDTINFFEDGVFDNVDGKLTGQIVDGRINCVPNTDIDFIDVTVPILYIELIVPTYETHINLTVPTGDGYNILITDSSVCRCGKNNIIYIKESGLLYINGIKLSTSQYILLNYSYGTATINESIDTVDINVEVTI